MSMNNKRGFKKKIGIHIDVFVCEGRDRQEVGGLRMFVHFDKEENHVFPVFHIVVFPFKSEYEWTP